MKTCPTCDGRGEVATEVQDMRVTDSRSCPMCCGDGAVDNDLAMALHQDSRADERE